PSFSRLILTAQSHRINAHITAYAPEKRLKTTVVEDASAIIDGQFSVYIGKKSPKKVYLAPHKTAVCYSVENGYIHIHVPIFKGYALIVIEY
ncbi:MAG: hypothetical protein WCS73_09680, partial [Lentisphaeria bacterium]